VGPGRSDSNSKTACPCPCIAPSRIKPTIRLQLGLLGITLLTSLLTKMSVSVPSSVDVEVQSCLTDLSDGTVSQETMVPESSMDSLSVSSSGN
jgi:hypothetical protein